MDLSWVSVATQLGVWVAGVLTAYALVVGAGDVADAVRHCRDDD